MTCFANKLKKKKIICS